MNKDKKRMQELTRANDLLRGRVDELEQIVADLQDDVVDLEKENWDLEQEQIENAAVDALLVLRQAEWKRQSEQEDRVMPSLSMSLLDSSS